MQRGGHEPPLAIFLSMLERPITVLKGIGEKRAALFQKLGVNSVNDLLRLMPREYLDYSTVTPVATAEDAEMVALKIRITAEPHAYYLRAKMQIVSATAADETGKIRLIWFNQPFRKGQLALGETYFACGRMDRTHGPRLVNPTLFKELPGLMAIYPLVQGLSQGQLRLAVRQALEQYLPACAETLPARLRSEYGLCGIQDALRNLHQPSDAEALKAARRRLSFEDVLYFMLAMAHVRREREKMQGIAFHTKGMVETFVSRLSFAPTSAQMRVFREIAADMGKKLPMNRLIQGDVGSGKTALAQLALYIAKENGFQGVLMAPTEVLARQHYQNMQPFFGDEICLVVGGMKPDVKAAAYERIADGHARVIVGTHALLQEKLIFHRLGLVVADEQHRFGVRQRAAIADKGNAPDVLIMSATPIPRTLALILYGDLDVSVLDEMPPGRKQVKTYFVPEEKREDLYAFLEKKVRMGQQAYVVCPLVETSEQLDVRSAEDVYKELQKKLPLKFGLLHGRMTSVKKERVLEAFVKKEIDCVVSTTVIEVGVDVPNATIMVIENAERFGLAQLHQLRGRVGRGEQQSFCFLLSGSRAETARRRLQVLTQTNDGFLIAQKDLEIRGPGQFLGTQQHGLDTLAATCMADDMDVLAAGRAAADWLITHPDAEESIAVLAQARVRLAGKLEGIAPN